MKIEDEVNNLTKNDIDKLQRVFNILTKINILLADAERPDIKVVKIDHLIQAMNLINDECIYKMQNLSAQLKRKRVLEEELNKTEQTPKLVINELYFYNFKGERCFGQLRAVDDKLTMYNLITKKSDIIEEQSLINIVSRVEITKMLVLEDFHNKLLSNQKQNDIYVDIDSIIFDKGE
jgi:hypothetical protein